MKDGGTSHFAYFYTHTLTQSRTSSYVHTHTHSLDLEHPLSLSYTHTHTHTHTHTGQFWNIPVTLELYNGIVFQDSPDETFYIVTVSHPESPVRQFPAFYWPRTWEVTKQATDPCLYAGSMQAGGTSEIKEFEDSVIQGQYLDYKLSGPFETEYVYSKFDRMRCSN